MNLLIWFLISLFALTCIAGVQRAIRSHRLAAGRESRRWFEYSLMAARNSEELTRR